MSALSVITALIAFSALAAVICVRARAAGPALFFGVVALVLLSATPAGATLAQLVEQAIQFGERAAARAGGW